MFILRIQVSIVTVISDCRGVMLLGAGLNMKVMQLTCLVVGCVMMQLIVMVVTLSILYHPFPCVSTQECAKLRHFYVQ